MGLGDLLARLRRSGERPRVAAPAPLPPTMGEGAEEFQTRLDEARERLRRDIPPPDADE